MFGCRVAQTKKNTDCERGNYWINKLWNQNRKAKQTLKRTQINQINSENETEVGDA